MSSQKTGSKVIVITGASSGIGKATAQALVDEGNKVALIARSEDKLDDLVAELGEANAFAVTADVSDFNDLEKAFSKVVQHYGQVDGVFANAVTGAKSAGIENGDVAEWQSMLGANVNGLLYTAKLGLPLLKKTKGHFILTSSVAGRKIGRAHV